MFKPPLPYAEVDEDYHMCPLSRQRTAGTSAKHNRKFLERQVNEVVINLHLELLFLSAQV